MIFLENIFSEMKVNAIIQNLFAQYVKKVKSRIHTKQIGISLFNVNEKDQQNPLFNLHEKDQDSYNN